MALPSQAPRSMVAARKSMMTRKKSRSPGPMAVAAVVGLCGLALVYVVVKPLFAGPSRAGAEETSPAAQPPREPTPGGAPIATRDQQREPERPATTPSQGRQSDAANLSTRTASNPGNSSTPRNTTNPGASNPGNTGPAPVSHTPTLATIPPPAGSGTATNPGPSAPPTPTNTAATGQDTAAALRTAEAEKAANRPVAARDVLLRAFSRTGLTEQDRARLRAEISTLNDEIIFSPRVFPGDSFTGEYTVRGGDSLSRIASRQGLGVDWRLIQRVNRMTTDAIREGQRLKVVRGPFHAVVDKSDYRLDLYAGPPDERENWVFIRSFTVGLGEDNGTPLGDFIVKRNSRLINPVWVNPRTGQRFDADDPQNPIGERWIGIRGLGEYEVIEGYGIHGTIDPASIGQQKSMGCVRMLSGDVELMYELMAEEISRVTIEP